MTHFVFMLLDSEKLKKGRNKRVKKVKNAKIKNSKELNFLHQIEPISSFISANFINCHQLSI